MNHLYAVLHGNISKMYMLSKPHDIKSTLRGGLAQ